jgi:hypothetical protein
MADNEIPLSIDYTSRDFYSLKSDLIKRVQQRVNVDGKQWDGADPSDFGVVMIEAFAHVGDLVNYYIDRVANENFLLTATQRQSLLDLAATYGYEVSGYRQAETNASFTNPTDVDMLVPAGTQLTTSVVTSVNMVEYTTELTFTVVEDVVVPASEDGVVAGQAVGVLVHGEDISHRPENFANPDDPQDIAGELIGTSTGLANQTWILSSNQIVDGSIRIFVKNGDYYTEWRRTDHLADENSNAPVYEARFDENNYWTITFGDNIAGAIPTIYEPIKAVYYIGGGPEANIDANKVFVVSSIPQNSGVTGTDLVGLGVENIDKGVNGENPESNDSIRKQAPKAISTLNRAVTLKDYENLTLAISGVGKAGAYATSPNAISLYVGPIESDTSTNYYPGFNPANTAPTSGWYSLKEDVESGLEDKTQIGTTVSVLPPLYSPVVCEVQYSKYPQYDYAVLARQVKFALIYGLGYNFTEFKEVIYPSDLEARITAIEGIRNVKVLKLYREGASSALTTLSATQGELFVFNEDGVLPYIAAGLSNVVFAGSAGTLSPEFVSTTFTYTLTGHASNTITVTPTVPDSTSTIKVNGTTVASGSASGSISTPSAATTVITVVVTSADATLSNTYTISVVR